MKTLRLLSSLALAAIPALVSAQSVWTNAGADYSFSNTANWAGGSVPASGADLVFSTSDFIGLDNGGDYLAHSLTIDAGVSGLFLPAGAETLSLGSGGITNLGFGVDFQATLLAVSTQTWSVGSGAFTIGNAFDVSAGATLTIDVANGATFAFAMNAANPDWAGNINFVGAINMATLTVTGAGLSSQNLSRITINGLEAVLVGDQLTTAAAIPEPSTYAALAGVGALLLAARRKCARRSAAVTG